MRQISPVWQRETPKAVRPCHPGAAEAVETPGATLSGVRDTPRTGVPGPNSPAEPTEGSSQSTPQPKVQSPKSKVQSPKSKVQSAELEPVLCRQVREIGIAAERQKD